MKKIFVILFSLFLLSTRVIAQDVYQVNWTLENRQYQAAIIIYNFRSVSGSYNSLGKARVKYFKNGEKIIVEETLSYKTTDEGFNLYGSNPVYPGTGIEFPNYYPDEFRISVYNDGSLYVMVSESGTLRMQPLGTSIQKITSKSDQVIFLRMFDWKL